MRSLISLARSTRPDITSFACRSREELELHRAPFRGSRGGRGREPGRPMIATQQERKCHAFPSGTVAGNGNKCSRSSWRQLQRMTFEDFQTLLCFRN